MDLSKYDQSYFVGNFKMADDLDSPADRAFYNFYMNQYIYRDLYLGTVMAVGNNVLMVKSSYGKGLMFSTSGGDQLYRSHVTIVTKKGSGYRAEPGKITDILYNDKLLIRNHDGYACDIVIYR